MAEQTGFPSTRPEPDEGRRKKRVTPELSGQQRALWEALVEKSDRLAKMYLGALLVLEDDANPDKLALAAHGLRELIDNFERLAAAPTNVRSTRLGDQVSELANRWGTKAKKSKCHKDGAWCGEIDLHLSKMLGEFEEFFKWHKKQATRRRQELAAILRALGSRGVRLPPPLEERTADYWDDIRDFFVAVAHHKNTSREEFEPWLYALEEFLLGRLRPRTFSELGEIDLIIREGASDAQS